MLEITKLSRNKAHLNLRKSQPLVPSVRPCPSHRPELVWSHLIDLIGCHVTVAAPRCPACALLTCHAFLLRRNRHCRCSPFCMSPRPSLQSKAAMQLENASYFINLQPPPRQTIISSSPNDSSWVAFCTAAALYLSSPA